MGPFSPNTDTGENYYVPHTGVQRFIYNFGAGLMGPGTLCFTYP